MSASSTLRAGLACLLLCLAALGARLAGVGALLPHAPEEDAYVVRQAELRRAGDEPEARAGRTVWRKYPHLLAGVLALAPLETPELPPLEPETLELHLDAASRPHRLGRSLVALVSCLAIALTWLLGRRFSGPWAALAPAALLATSLLPHFLSQQARPHGPVGTFTLACVLAAVCWVQRPRLSVALGAAVAAALAIGCLHNGIAGLVPLATAWLLAWPRSTPRLRVVAVGAPALAVAAALALGYPFLFELLWSGSSLTDEGSAGHAVDTSGFNGGGFATLWAAVRHNDPLLGAAALVGLAALALRRREWSAEQRLGGLVVAAFGLPYALVIGLYDRSFERFALPLWPILALLAAVGADALGRALGARLATLRHAPLIALLAIQSLLVARKVQLDLRPDTYELTAEYVREHLPARSGGLLLVTRAFLPLPMVETHTPFGDESWGGLYQIPWREHLLTHPPDVDAFAFQVASGRSTEGRRGIRYADGRLGPALVDSVRAQLQATGARYVVSLHTEGLGGRSTFEQLMGGYAELLHSISPWPADTEAPAEVGYQGESAWRRLIRGDRFGPTLRIWRLPG